MIGVGLGLGLVRPLGHTLSKGVGGGSLPVEMRPVSTRVAMSEMSLGSGNPNVLVDNIIPLQRPVNGTLRIWWPNYRVSGGVIFGTGGAATATAQLVYTEAGTGTVKTVALLDATTGSTTIDAPDKGHFIAEATIAADAQDLKAQFRGNYPGGSGGVYQQQMADIAGGDRFQFGATVPALGTTPINTLANVFSWYGPVRVEAMSDQPAALIGGDSIDRGWYDVPNDSYGDNGLWPRLLGRQGVPYVSVAANSQTAKQLSEMASDDPRRALFAGCTFVGIGTGINDILGATTAAAAMGYNEAFATLVDLPAVYRTLPPATSEGITTPGAAESKRTAYNTLVRAKPAYWDPDAVLGNNGAWRSFSAVYLDYLHPVANGNQWAAINAAIVGTSADVQGFGPRAQGTVMPDQNLLANPGNMGTSPWGGNNSTVTNAGAADQQMRETTATGAHDRSQSIAKAASAKRYRIEIDLKNGLSRDWARLTTFNGAFGAGTIANINLSSGSIGSVYSFGSYSIANAQRYLHPSGYYGVGFDVTTDTNPTLWAIFSAATADEAASYAGNTANGLYMRNPRVYEKA